MKTYIRPPLTSLLDIYLNQLTPKQDERVFKITPHITGRGFIAELSTLHKIVHRSEKKKRNYDRLVRELKILGIELIIN